MLMVKATARDSAIAGKGLFVDEPVTKGTVVSLHAADAVVLTEDEYQHEQRIGNELAIRTGNPLGGPIFSARQIRTTGSLHQPFEGSIASISLRDQLCEA